MSSSSAQWPDGGEHRPRDPRRVRVGECERQQAAEGVGDHVHGPRRPLGVEGLDQVGDMGLDVPGRIPPGASVPAQVDGQHPAAGQRVGRQPPVAAAVVAHPVDDEH